LLVCQAVIVLDRSIGASLAAVAYELPADVTLEVWDGLENVSPFNEDLEDGPAPVSVAELRSVIKDADGG
jgi:chromate reductase, NAD(P)H dehydrogenase (quinone)